MNMKIILNKTRITSNKNGLYVGKNDLKVLTLPTFTKKLFFTALRN